MYKEIITKQEIEKSDERTQDFFHYITKCTGWYRENENGDFVISNFGKHCSDDDDMYHGNGRPYGTKR